MSIVANGFGFVWFSALLYLLIANSDKITKGGSDNFRIAFLLWSTSFIALLAVGCFLMFVSEVI